MKKALIFAALLAIASFGFAGTAKADQITVDNVTFTFSVTATTVNLTVQCGDPSCSGWFLADTSLKGFTFTSGPTDITVPTGFAVQNGGQNNGQGGGCNNTQLGQAVCWNTSTPLTLQLGTSPITFQAAITNGVVGSDGLHIQTVVYDSASADPGTRVFAISSNGTIETPEPASLTLLGLSLLGVPFLRRKK